MAALIYINDQDLERRFGPQEISDLKNHVGGTEAEMQDTLRRAYRDATDEMNSYLSVRYAVAVVFNPPVEMIKIYCCDIARFRLWGDQPTEEVRKRYERALSWLADVRDGKANVLDDDGEFIPEADKYQRPIASVSRPQIFTEALFDAMPGRGDDF